MLRKGHLRFRRARYGCVSARPHEKDIRKALIENCRAAIVTLLEEPDKSESARFVIVAYDAQTLAIILPSHNRRRQGAALPFPIADGFDRALDLDRVNPSIARTFDCWAAPTTPGD